MLKKLLLLMIVPALFFACNNVADNAEATDAEVTAIEVSEFDNLAKDYIDQEIEVTGIVDHICKHGGKKIHLVTDKEGEESSLHIVSEEAFNEELEGQHIKVRGFVVEEQITDKTIDEWEAEHAKKQEEKDAEEAELEEDAENEETELAATEEASEEVAETESEEAGKEDEECEDKEKDKSECGDDEDHHKKDSDVFAKWREKVATTEDGIYRIYHIKYVSHEIVEAE